jgi:ADP-heptose:LPS heptosyltransferase
VSNWRLLSEALIADGNDLVFTGTGQRELENVSSVIDGLSNCINMCGVLSWYDFVSTIKNASLVICVESLAAHIAASFEINCVAIFSGMSNHNHWRPLSERVRLVFNPLPCAPCYKSRGCDTMACVRDVHPHEVYLEAKEQINQLKKL